jgi:preprotein translocase subunit SecG
LLQPGKSDAGALFTSSVSSTAFGPRGTLNILSKITIVAATLFMLSAFLLSQNALTGGRSVLESGAIPAESPATTGGDANANSAVATENAMGANTATANTATDNANTAATTTNTAASNANAGNANAAASPAANTATANQAANNK